MKFLLITVKKIVKVEILTEPFLTKEEAFNKMRDELIERLKKDGDEKYISLLDDGVELSNAILCDDGAYIYQDYGQIYHHWKIVEI